MPVSGSASTKGGVLLALAKVRGATGKLETGGGGLDSDDELGGAEDDDLEEGGEAGEDDEMDIRGEDLIVSYT